MCVYEEWKHKMVNGKQTAYCILLFLHHYRNPKNFTKVFSPIYTNIQKQINGKVNNTRKKCCLWRQRDIFFLQSEWMTPLHLKLCKSFNLEAIKKVQGKTKERHLILKSSMHQEEESALLPYGAQATSHQPWGKTKLYSVYFEGVSLKSFTLYFLLNSNCTFVVPRMLLLTVNQFPQSSKITIRLLPAVPICHTSDICTNVHCDCPAFLPL